MIKCEKYDRWVGMKRFHELLPRNSFQVRHCLNSVILCLLDFVSEMVLSSSMFREIVSQEKSYLGRDLFLYNNKLLCKGVYYFNFQHLNLNLISFCKSLLSIPKQIIITIIISNLCTNPSYVFTSNSIINNNNHFELKKQKSQQSRVSPKNVNKVMKDVVWRDVVSTKFG